MNAPQQQPANQLVSIVVMFSMAAFGLWMFFNYINAVNEEVQKPNNVSETATRPKRAAVSTENLTVAELNAAFRANELSFDQRYAGKTVTITGQVDDVKDGLFDQGYIVNFIGELNGFCELASDQLDAAAKLSAGQTVKLQGVVEKGIVGFSLSDCAFQQ